MARGALGPRQATRPPRRRTPPGRVAIGSKRECEVGVEGSQGGKGRGKAGFGAILGCVPVSRKQAMSSSVEAASVAGTFATGSSRAGREGHRVELARECLHRASVLRRRGVPPHRVPHPWPLPVALSSSSLLISICRRRARQAIGLVCFRIAVRLGTRKLAHPRGNR